MTAWYEHVKMGCLVALTIAALIFLWRTDKAEQQVTADSHSLVGNLSGVVGKVSATADRVNAAVPDPKKVAGLVDDLTRVIQLAGGVLNVTRDIERDNRKDIQAANEKTLATLGHVDDLIVSFNQSQRDASMAIQRTSAAVIPVMTQTATDLKALEPAIQQGTAIASNLNGATADVAQEIHKFVYPPPRKWWQRWVTDPAKVAAHLITIPLGHL